MNYESTVRINSVVEPQITYVVARISFARRLELMRLVRGLATELEFHEAGLSEIERMHTAILSAQIDRLYVSWGLLEVEGLIIDGQKATPDLLSSLGPESFFNEALAAVRAECSLTEQERKN